MEGTKRQIVGIMMMLALVFISVMPAQAHGTANGELSVTMAYDSKVKMSRDHGGVLIDSHSHEEQGASDNCCVAFCAAAVILPWQPSLPKGIKMIHLSYPVLVRTSVEEISLHRPPSI